jgi:hypothetical protein
MRRSITPVICAAVLLAIVLAVLPHDAGAQTCLGIPTERGQSAVALRAGFTEGFDTYGAEASTTFQSGLAFLGHIGTASPTGQGESRTTIGGRASFTFPDDSRMQLCPTAGIEHRSWRQDYWGDRPPVLGAALQMSQVRIAAGLAFGAALPTGPFRTILYAVPQFLLVRTEAGESGAVATSVTESWSGVAGEVGLTLSLRRVYAGVAVQASMLEDDDALLEMRVGVRFGSGEK